jgi:GDP-L-fucose synthase
MSDVQLVPKPLIFVAGHRGMVGSAIKRQLLAQGHPQDRILTCTRDELDLKDQGAVRTYFERHRPDQVYLAAARVGGIHANSSLPADFLLDNLLIQSNVIDAAFRGGVRKLLFLGSSCIYPRSAEQPMREEALLSGPLEPTNEPYAIAKIAGIKLCESLNRQYGASDGIDYRSVMPTNLYGPGDNYHPLHSHVIPALIRRFHEARLRGDPEVAVWGSGHPMREFLHVDDMARACIHVMNIDLGAYALQTRPMLSHLNVGYGSDVSIAELAHLVARVTDYVGRTVFDSSKPDGAPRKLMDSERLRALGWAPRIGLAEGLASTYQDFLSDAVRRG